MCSFLNTYNAHLSCVNIFNAVLPSYMLAKYFKKEGVTEYVTGMKTAIIQLLWLLVIYVTLLHIVTYRFTKTELQ